MLEELQYKVDNLVDLLIYRAQQQPDALLYTFLSDQEGQYEERTYAQIDSRARAIASKLQSLNIEGGRALMLYPSGLEFIEAFFGCLYAGLIAVPAYPPRKNQKLGRLQSIIDNCQPAVVLCSEDVSSVAKPLFDDLSEDFATQLHWLSTDSVDVAEAEHWNAISVNATDLAFLQYTSGSTGDPKGVMVSHENIMTNEEMIRVAFGFKKEHKFVSWLPMFHDMGLIGTTLHPIYLGASSVLMTPASFLRQPLRWLKAISDYRAEVSVAPNFAYELCVEQISEEQREGLDLSCWTHALSGAEPVRAETLHRFHDYFSPQGFSWESYYPVYGMAETTLIITGGGSLERPRIETVSSQEIARNEFRLLASSEARLKHRHSDAMDIVGVGEAVLDQEVVIVDPETKERAHQDKVGEIWVAGKHVGQGYWNNEALSEKIFKARIKNNDGSSSNQAYLRTGDLGCYLGDELFITGRLKEVIIVRGRNYYPYDIELIAQQSHPYLKIDSSAAFSVEVKGQEQIVLFMEVERKHRLKVNGDEIASAVRKAIAREHGLQVYGVCLLKPGRIPKTSSGKIQRGACKRAFENESMEFIAKSLHVLDIKDQFEDISLSREALQSLSDSERRGKIIEYLRASAAVLLQVDIQEVPAEQALTSLGLDSLQVTQLVSRVRDHLQVELAIDELFDLESLAQVADLTVRLVQTDPALRLPSISKRQDNNSHTLSFSQKRLWFLDQLEPGNAAYNNPAALKIRGKLDMRILSQCIEEVVRRHSVLRTRIIEKNGDAFPVVDEMQGWHLPVEDLSGLSNAAKEVEIKCLASEEAACTFNMARGSLFRTRLLQLGELDSEDEAYVLLITAHHIVSDGWSLNILLEELSALYACFSLGQPSPLTELSIQYYDFSEWQQQWLQGDVLNRQLKYWKNILGDVPALELPLDHARPPAMSQRGKQVSFQLSQSLTADLKSLSQSQGVTLFMTLFSGFAVLLNRYSGQEDFAIGTPIANRTRAELERLIGFFVNTLALRVDLKDKPSFIEVLERVQEITLGAYANQDVPFERLVEELGVVRDMSHTPLFQVMFAFQNSPMRVDMELDGLDFEIMQVHGQSSKFDLSLDLREVIDGIEGFVEYNSDIFDEITIKRFVNHFSSLLESIVQDPGESISDFEFLSSDELKLLLVDLNSDLNTVPPTGACIHSVFEEQCRKTPNNIAMVFKDISLTYEQLNKEANQISHYLVAQGVGAEDLVGVCLYRSQHLIPVLLGILKVGAAYVPLDPKYPSARLEQIIYAAEAKFLIGDESLREDLPTNDAQCFYIDDIKNKISGLSEENLELALTDANLAYVIYTSGSTGLPKGVAIEHRSTVALMSWAAMQYEPSELEAVLASTSVCFDLSIFEFFVPLSVGGKVVLVDSILDLLEEFSEDISLINTVPSAISTLESQNAIPQSVRTINLAGEALSSQLVDKLYETAHIHKIYDLYGPSEDTTYSTCMLRERFAYASIGRPIANTQAYILDQNLKPVPHGVPGELYLAGAGLARGYYGQTALTAERFIENPFKIQRHKGFGTRMYRTGDLARYLSSGEIEYLGRSDFQVKLRGFRIELGEVQTALSKIRNIRDAVAFVRDDILFADDNDQGEQQVLVAYIVFNEGLEIDAASANSFLRSKLKEMLPAYMVPSVFVPLEEIPLTPNGKTDRARLPIPDMESLTSSDYREARTAFEQGLVEIWSGVLGQKRIGVYDNFFDLGGHSLLATQVVARIRDTFQVDLPVRTIFDQPTIFELSALISDQSTQQDLYPIEIRANSQLEQVPLSFAQQRLWFLHLLDKTSAAYNMPAKLHIRGALDVTVLKRVFVTMVQRHAALRTRFFIEEGNAFQKVQPSPTHWDFEEAELAGKTVSTHQEIDAFFQHFSRRAFNLEDLDIEFPEKRLLRSSLIKVSEKEHVLIINMHHIVSDGWSMNILLKELKALYESVRLRRSAQLAPVNFQYSDYAIWQREWMSGDRLERQMGYWKEQLKNISILEMPSDRPRQAMQSSRGERIPFHFSTELSNKLYRQTREQNVTLFMVMLAGFKALLFRYTGQHDIAVGTPLANRTHPEWESLIGFFVNTLVLRTQISPNDSFIDLVKQVQEVTLDGYANQDLPFDKLVEELSLHRDSSHSPLFQVAFTLQSNAVSESIDIDRLAVSVQGGNTHTAKFDITMELQEHDGEIRGELEYNTDLFDRASMLGFVEHYEVLMNALLDNPRQNLAEAPLLSATEQTLILEESAKQKAMQVDLHFVHHIFEQQAHRHPSKVAVKSEGVSVTYGELNIAANRLACHLRNEGLKQGQLLPLFVERSIEMVVGVLACLKAGAGYVPIDPMTPDERVNFIIDDVFAAQSSGLLLSQNSLLNRINRSGQNLKIVCVDDIDKGARLSDSNIELVDHHLTDPAYVIYTSGTTGKPKGVVVSHQNVARLFQNSESLFSFNEKDVWTLFHSFSFDFSVWELWGALLYGGKLIVIPQHLSRATEDFYKLLFDEKVTILNQTPSAFSQLIAVDEKQQEKLSLRKVIFGGEALDFSTLRTWVERHGFDKPELINMYGITETTVHVTCYRLQEKDLQGHRSVIGQTLPDLQAFVLDSFLKPVPRGVVGELFVGGAGVAKGYLNRAELSREKFLTMGIPGIGEQYLYRTGDLVRRLEDESLEYLGRIDDQVKIRGFRIELGEIEFNINNIETVKESIVLIKPDMQGEDAIVAYVAVNKVEEVFASDLRAALVGSLPEYMIPKAFVMVERLPLTVNGKVDKKSLENPDWGRLSSSEYISPRNDTESALTQIWEDVLKIESVGIYDNFFEVGGHSLLATQIVSRIRDSLEMELPLNVIFETPTVADIAFYLIEQEALDADEDLLEALLDELEGNEELESSKGDVSDNTLSDVDSRS